MNIYNKIIMKNENENKYNYIEKMKELFGGDVNVNEIIITNNNDLLKKYIADIRNIKKLDKEMIANISSMCNEDKMKIITVYNEMLDAFCDYINNIK